MSDRPASGDAGGEAPAKRLASALDAVEARLQENGDADAIIEAVAKTLPDLHAAAKAVRDG